MILAISMSVIGVFLILDADLSISFFRGSWLSQYCLIRVFLIHGVPARNVGWLDTSHSSAATRLVCGWLGLKCGGSSVLVFHS